MARMRDFLTGGSADSVPTILGRARYDAAVAARRAHAAAPGAQQQQQQQPRCAGQPWRLTPACAQCPFLPECKDEAGRAPGLRLLEGLPGLSAAALDRAHGLVRDLRAAGPASATTGALCNAALCPPATASPSSRPQTSRWQDTYPPGRWRRYRGAPRGVPPGRPRGQAQGARADTRAGAAPTLPAPARPPAPPPPVALIQLTSPPRPQDEPLAEALGVPRTQDGMRFALGPPASPAALRSERLDALRGGAAARLRDGATSLSLPRARDGERAVFVSVVADPRTGDLYGYGVWVRAPAHPRFRLPIASGGEDR